MRSFFALSVSQIQVMAKEDFFVMAVRMNKVKRAPATMEEALDRFITWKKANGISDQTILDYSTHVNLLFKKYPDAKESYDQLEQAVVDHLGQWTRGNQARDL